MKQITMSQIREPLSLPAAFQENEFFKALVSSIKVAGQISPITVTYFNGKYNIIDGLMRYLALKELGMHQIQVNVIPTGEISSIKPSEKYVRVSRSDYRRALLRIIAGNPAMSIQELSEKIERPRDYIEDVLGWKFKDGPMRDQCLEHIAKDRSVFEP